MQLRDRVLSETPIAVIDLETTGLSATSDRIVEIAIARIDPGEAPRVVLDTIVNPQRRVTCSEIHGIYDEDVVGAPLFDELAQPIADALDGAVVAAFNVYFDIKFLDAGLSRSGIPLPLPHLCLMWLRPALGLGDRANLGATCSAMGMTFDSRHCAGGDALASAKLWAHYLRAAEAKGVRTFGDLAALKSYKFTKSWTSAPIQRASVQVKPLGTALKPRQHRSETERMAVRRREWTGETREPAVDAVAEYWGAIKDAIVDQQITPSERKTLRNMRYQLRLADEDVRFVHARVLSGVLDDVTSDSRIDPNEMRWLYHVAELLRSLGWAPGDDPEWKVPVREQAESIERAAPREVAAENTYENGELVASSWWSKVFG